MGRRKIEIQPIQHDRNRSVTFLKRKNGLFKKAYELGVLCSADVAVIVFGHNHKLYEYCSTDINALLARQREYSGDRDTKGPSDFSADKGDGGDDDSDSGGEAPPARGKAPQSKPKGKGASSNDTQALGPEGRFAVPPPLPEPDRAPSRPIKREELPPIITSVNTSAPPITSAARNTSLPSSGGSSMRWQNDNAFSAQSNPMGMSQSFEPQGPDWATQGAAERRPSWPGGMPQSGMPGPSTPINSFYQAPPISQPAISRSVPLLTPSHSHPTPLNEILAAHPHLAQQLGSAASPSSGFGNNTAMHELYNNPIFQQITSQGPPSSSSQGQMDMDWRMQAQGQYHAPPRNPQHFPPPQQPNNLPNDLSWLEMLGQGDRGSSEPWSVADNRERSVFPPPKSITPLGFTPTYQQPPLKRPLSSTTPISPPETGGTPHQEVHDELDPDNTLGILEGELGGKRARIQ